MKNTETVKQFENALAKAIAELNGYGKKMIVKKDYTDFFASIETTRLSAIAYYQAKESGKDAETLAKFENLHYTSLRNMLAFIGKINGFNLKAGAINEGTTLFIDSLAFVTKVKKVSTSNAMAHAKNEKKLLTEKMTKALAEKRYTDYESTKEKLQIIEKKIAKLTDESGNESRIQSFVSGGAYTKAIIVRLSQIINNIATKSAEQLKAEQDALNGKRKENRKNNSKSKNQKTESKTATEKKVA